MSRYNNSKGSKNSQYSSNPGLTEKLSLYAKRSFRHLSTHTKKNQRLLSQDYGYH